MQSNHIWRKKNLEKADITSVLTGWAGRESSLSEARRKEWEDRVAEN